MNAVRTSHTPNAQPLENDSSSLTLPNDERYVRVALAYVESIARRLGYSYAEIRRLSTAVNEAVFNVHTHAHDSE